MVLERMFKLPMISNWQILNRFMVPKILTSGIIWSHWNCLQNVHTYENDRNEEYESHQILCSVGELLGLEVHLWISREVAVALIQPLPWSLPWLLPFHLVLTSEAYLGTYEGDKTAILHLPKIITVHLKIGMTIIKSKVYRALCASYFSIVIIHLVFNTI